MDMREIIAKGMKIVAIVHFKANLEYYNGGVPTQNPACLLQITIDPGNISPSRNLIRLGETRGDEIMGWQKIDALEVVELLGKLEGEDEVVPLAA